MQRLYGFILFALLGRGVAGQSSLTYFIEAAHRNNPIARLDSLQAVSSQLTLGQQEAALTAPQIGLDGAYLAAPILSTDDGTIRLLLNPSKNTTGYYGYDLSLTNGGLYRGVVSIQQSLLTGPQRRILEAQYRLQQAQLAGHTRLALRQLDKNITDQYLLCEYMLRQKTAIRQLLDVVNAQVRVSDTLARNALAYQADVRLLQLEADRLDATITALDASFSARLLDLYIICGIKDTTPVQLASLTLQLSDEQPQPSGFTEQYRLDSLTLINSQQLFDLRYRPQLGVFGSAGLNTAYAPDINRRFGWQAGLRFTQILFDGHQRLINDRRIRLLSRNSTWQTDYFDTQNEVRKTKLKAQVKALEDQQAATRRQMEEYDTVLLLYKKQVLNGQLSVINYLTVLRSRAALQQDLATETYNRELLINEYNYWNW